MRMKLANRPTQARIGVLGTDVLALRTCVLCMRRIGVDFWRERICLVACRPPRHHGFRDFDTAVQRVPHTPSGCHPPTCEQARRIDSGTQELWRADRKQSRGQLCSKRCIVCLCRKRQVYSRTHLISTEHVTSASKLCSLAWPRPSRASAYIATRRGIPNRVQGMQSQTLLPTSQSCKCSQAPVHAKAWSPVWTMSSWALPVAPLMAWVSLLWPAQLLVINKTLMSCDGT